MLWVGIFLTLVACATAEDLIVQDINEMTDVMLKNGNRYFKQAELTQAPILEGDFGPHIYHSAGLAMGLTTLARTGNCTYILDPNQLSFTYDYKIGSTFLFVAFNQIEFMGKNQTAYFRIKNNSLHVRFTGYTQTDDRCNITAEDLSFERLADIEFGSSEAPEGSANVEKYFAETVLPSINMYLKSEIMPLFQAYLTSSCTRQPDSDLGNLFELFLQPYSES